MNSARWKRRCTWIIWRKLKFRFWTVADRFQTETFRGLRTSGFRTLCELCDNHCLLNSAKQFAQTVWVQRGQTLSSNWAIAIYEYLHHPNDTSAHFIYSSHLKRRSSLLLFYHSMLIALFFRSSTWRWANCELWYNSLAQFVHFLQSGPIIRLIRSAWPAESVWTLSAFNELRQFVSSRLSAIDSMRLSHRAMLNELVRDSRPESGSFALQCGLHRTPADRT